MLLRINCIPCQERSQLYECRNKPLLFLRFRYLADLMDNARLIRNVAIAGHLHNGKVHMYSCGPLIHLADTSQIRVLLQTVGEVIG